jgi:hypothetical protein
MTTVESLTPEDILRFQRLGIPIDLLRSAHVCRVTDDQARRDYGMTPNGDLSGIVFPYMNPVTELRTTARLRRDNPEVDPNGNLLNKYVSPFGDNRHLYFPPGVRELLNDTTAPLILVEAEKSALAITALAARRGRRLLAIATGGCWGWRGKTGIETGANGERAEARGPLPDFGLVALARRKAIILFDANAATNPRVQAARRALAESLQSRGAEVCLCHLAEEAHVNGPDDFIAIHGDEALLGLIDNAREWRPSITLNAGEYPRAVDEAEEILCARAESLRIFQRAGELVRVITLPDAKHGGGLRREPGTVQLVPLGGVALTEVWDRLIEWRKLKAKKANSRVCE